MGPNVSTRREVCVHWLGLKKAGPFVNRVQVVGNNIRMSKIDFVSQAKLFFLILD